MEHTNLFVAEPFVEGNKNLANTVILYEDWIFLHRRAFRCILSHR